MKIHYLFSFPINIFRRARHTFNGEFYYFFLIFFFCKKKLKFDRSWLVYYARKYIKTLSLLSAGSQICGKHQGYKSRDSSLETPTRANLVTIMWRGEFLIIKMFLSLSLLSPDRKIINTLGIIKNWSTWLGSPALIRLCSDLLNWVLFIFEFREKLWRREKRIKWNTFYWVYNYIFLACAGVCQLSGCPTELRLEYLDV